MYTLSKKIKAHDTFKALACKLGLKDKMGIMKHTARVQAYSNRQADHKQTMQTLVTTMHIPC